MFVTPLAASFANQTPYQYAGNNPVNYNDPTGLLTQAEFWTIIDNLLGSSSPYGGEWYSDGNGGGSLFRYGSDMEAFYAGAEYMEAHGLWGGGGGSFASSFEAAANAYENATGEPLPLRWVDVVETRTNSNWLQTRIDEALSGGNPITPWEVGWEWLTGEGPRHRDFTNGDYFTEMLRQHDHVTATRAIILDRISTGGTLKDENPYSLSGVQGISKYLKDYSTLATGGTTGNIAVTYLGSYGLQWEVIDINGNLATVLFTVNNSSTIQSATRPPVLGYTQWWQNTVGPWLNQQLSSGPMSPTTQTFMWTELIRIR